MSQIRSQSPVPIERADRLRHQLVTYPELAEYLGVTVRYLYQLVKKGRIKPIRIGPSCSRFDLEEVMSRLKEPN